MRQPETPLEIWLARDGWNEIDPGLLRQRAKIRVWQLLAIVLVCALLTLFTGGKSAWQGIGIGLFCLIFAGFEIYRLWGDASAFKPPLHACSFENLLTSDGKNFLEQKLKEIVGPNNTRDRRPDEYPPAHELTIQNSAKEVFNDKELHLLDPLADLVINKMDQMDRGANEPFIFLVNLSESMRIAFSLIAKLQADQDQFQQVEAEFLRMREIIQDFPIVHNLEDPENLDLARGSYRAWRAFTRQHHSSTNKNRF